MSQESESLSFEQILGVIRHRLPLIVLCMVIAAGAAYGFSKRETKKYTATASLNFSNNSLSQQIAGLAPSTNSSLLAAQQASNIELVRLGDMAAKTATLLGHGLNEAKVAGSVHVEGHSESSVVDVSATSTSPVLAAAIANTYAKQYVKEQESANRRYLKSALAIVHKQLAALSPQQRIGSDGLELQDRAQTLSLLSELQEGTVTIASEAAVPASPSSPRTSRNTVLGLLLGLVLGLVLVFLLERLNRQIKQAEELEAIYRLPSLGAIPKSATLALPAHDKRGRRAVLPPAEAEAFSLILAHLRFFNINRELRTIIIASPAPEDGKSTAARHLAEAAARLGTRTLLLEADLRHPTLAQQLGIQPGLGLADVLIGATTISNATQSVALEAPPGEGIAGRTLNVLPAGATLPPNPAELLESGAMDTVLQQARSTYDLVVIDTPPLTAVSDAFPLLVKVDGVVIVGWIGRSRRDSAEQLHQVLASSGAPLLGVIANGFQTGGPSVYHYPNPSSSKIGPVLTTSNGTSPSEDLTPTSNA
jgi:capsular exopolysaccharide synthesis family protein